MQRTLLALLSSLALLVAPLSLRADSGEIELNADCAAVGCLSGDAPGYPISITQPGHYRLTSDLVISTFDVGAISMGIDGGATLDLGGHAVIGPYTCPTAGSCTPADVSTASGIVFAARHGRLFNGTVRGFEQGIIIAPNQGLLLEDLQVIGNHGIGIYSALSAIEPMQSGDCAMRRLIVLRNAVGISLQQGDLTPRCTLERVNVSLSQHDGVRTRSLLVISDSIFESNGGLGVNAVFSGGRIASARSLYINNNGAAENSQYASGATPYNLGNNVCSSAACF